MVFDMHSSKIEKSLKINRVGVSGVRKPVTIMRADRVIQLSTTMDVFLDLPSDQRGSHLSRNLEVLTEIIDETVRIPGSGLEYISAKIAERLLEKHSYATYTEVYMIADYYLERGIDDTKKSLEPYKIIATAKAYRNNNDIERHIGVEVIGISACPCAQDTIREEYTKRYPHFKEMIETVPMPTHNQRVRTTVLIQVPENKEIEADKIIELIEKTFSSPTYAILKRIDEATIVDNAHRNPRFVEDIVRETLLNIIKMYTDFPDNTKIYIKTESEESIHKHNAFAETETTFGDVRKLNTNNITANKRR